jgi:alkyl hydroperoxide reductase subunit AhpF
VVVGFDGRVLVDPSNAELAQALGIKTRPEPITYDVTVVGAGPAGLAAAMYGASEGLVTAVLEHEAEGGQAGTSSMIRNYLGFPRGVSGAELASRAYEQASRAYEQAWILGPTSSTVPAPPAWAPQDLTGWSAWPTVARRPAGPWSWPPG